MEDPEEDHLMDNPLEQERQQYRFNSYASQKSVSQTLLNTSIIQGHIGILVFIFSQNPNNLSGFETTLIILIALSLTLQFTIYICLTILFYVRPDYRSVYRCFRATYINGFVTGLSGLSLIINIAITTVSLEIKKG